MAIFLQVGSQDLSQYVAVQGDDLDAPPAGFSEPQFAGVPAFSEGAEFVTDALGNREWVVPLILDGTNRSALHSLIRDTEAALANGESVQFATDSTDPITHFTLERGRLDVAYRYMLSVHATTRATLRLWTRPLGHTGTARTVASFVSTGLQAFPATGILGDTDALANLEVRVGSRIASSGRLVGFGVHRSASFNGLRGPSSADFVAQTGATVRGASGAVGSQYLAIPISPTTASGIALTSYLTPPGGHVGRHRVLALARSRLDVPITLWARDAFGAPLGPTTAASQTDPAKWGTIDLGEIHVPARASGQEAVPTQRLELIAGGAANAAIQASPALELNRLVYLPLEVSPGLLRTRGYEDTLLYGDGFDRAFGIEETFLLVFSPNADRGGVWKHVAGQLGKSVSDAAGGYVGPLRYGAGATHVAGGTGFFSLASGAQEIDVYAKMTFNLFPSGILGSPSAFASGAHVALWAKTTGAPDNVNIGASGVRAEISWVPTPLLTIWRGASVVGATANAMSVASGLQNGLIHTLILRTHGPTAAVWLGTSPDTAAAPLLAHGNDGVAHAGYPAIQMRQGAAGGWPILHEISLSRVGSAADTEAREWFRFESQPECRAYQGNASVFRFERAGEFRGEHPRLPAVGSPGASGPARAIVLAGEVDAFLGNDVIDIRFDAVERFTFLR